jgi:hypothetical protein
MDEVYLFLTSKELQDIKSMRTVVERITQQTLECSYFIRQYAEDTKFRELTWLYDIHVVEFISSFQGSRLGKNLISDTDDRVKDYNDVFDKLLQEFRDRAAGDTMVVVHRIWRTVEDLGESVLTYSSSRLSDM